VNNKQASPAGLTAIIAVLTMIGPFSIDTYLPSFPDIEAEYHISRALLTQSLGFYLLSYAIGTLILGPLADRLGRSRVIYVSLSFYVATSIGCALASNYHVFLFFRLLQGAAAAGGLVSGRAMIRDVYSPQDAHRAMSKVTMLFAVAPAIAPIIGGALDDWFGWRSVFYFLAGFAALVLMLMMLHVPETLAPELRQSFHPLNVARVYGRTLTHKRFAKIILITASIFAGMFLYVAGAPSVIYEYLQLDSNDFYLLFVPLVCGLIFGSWVSGKLSHRWSMERTVNLALSLQVIGVVLNLAQAHWLAPMIFTSIAPLIFYTCGIGIAMPALSIMAVDCFPQNRGTATAMQGFSQMISNAFMSSIAVPILIKLPVYLALGQAALLACALILWWRVPSAPLNDD